MISSYGRLWPNTNKINFKGMSVSDRLKKHQSLNRVHNSDSGLSDEPGYALSVENCCTNLYEKTHA